MGEGFCSRNYLFKEQSSHSTDESPEINAATVSICESMSARCASTAETCSFSFLLELCLHFFFFHMPSQTIFVFILRLATIACVPDISVMRTNVPPKHVVAIVRFSTSSILAAVYFICMGP